MVIVVKSCGIGHEIEWSEDKSTRKLMSMFALSRKKHQCFINGAIISALQILLPLHSNDSCINSAKKNSLANTHDVRNSFLLGERLCPAS